MPVKKDNFYISILYCLIQVFYWGTGFISIGYAAAFLRSAGEANSVIGFVCSGAALIGFLIVFMLSSLIDRKGMASGYYAIGIMLALQLLFAVCIWGGSSCIAMFYLLYASISHALGALLPKLYIDLRKQGYNVDFGLSRGLGSLAYAITSFVVGGIMTKHSANCIHLINMCLYLCLLLLIFMLFNRTRPGFLHVEETFSQSHNLAFSFSGFIRRSKYFLLLTMGVSLVSAANKTFSTFLVAIVEHVGGDAQNFTDITGYLALLEIPVMLFFSKIKNRQRVSTVLVISLFLFTVKLGGATIAKNIPTLFMAVVFQAFASGLFRPSTVEFVRENVAFEDTGKCQSLLDGAPLLVSFVTTSLCGLFMDSFGTGFVCVGLFFAAAVGLVLSFFTIRCKYSNNPKNE